MQRKSLRLSFAFIISVVLFSWGCTKIDYTTLGSDLIPAVDNVHTFADTFYLNGQAEPYEDTVRLTTSENHVIGRLNDPVFGNTNAELFLQLKPTHYPYYFGNARDTIDPVYGTKFDSAFLCLSYKGFYGDTTIPQTLKVYEIDQNTTDFKDSSYLLTYTPNGGYTNLIGELAVTPARLKDTVFFRYRKDSITNQIRIPLKKEFLDKITSYDTLNNNVFRSDSLFRNAFKGFAVVSDNGVAGNGGLFYVSLTDAATRLEIQYSRKNGGAIDTTYSAFTFSLGSTDSSLAVSAHANHITRDVSASELATAPQPDALYLQSAPGNAISFAIPGLNGYPNRIIHRAEIFAEQVPGNTTTDAILAPSPYVYLDLVDTTLPVTYKPIYYDLSQSSTYNPDASTGFYPANGIDHSYFGAYVRTEVESGVIRKYYTFNVTRYVQNMITKRTTNYKMRLTAPYNLFYKGLSFVYNNPLAGGRFKFNNGTAPDHRFRMRIVYSNL